MKIGFVSAIFPELTLEEIFKVASEIGFDCFELICWPSKNINENFSGMNICHLDIDLFDNSERRKIEQYCYQYSVDISGLGYYANPLSSDLTEAMLATASLKKLIQYASDLGINLVNSFAGKNAELSINDNWSRFLNCWGSILEFADQQKVKVALENSPMLRNDDQWLFGRNMACSPPVWRRMFDAFPTENFGLNFDPAHFILLQMDYLQAVGEFGDRIFHVHAQDTRLEREKLNQIGIMANPESYTSSVIPGLGDVQWNSFFTALDALPYNGAVCLEVEGTAYYGSLEERVHTLKQGYQFLRRSLG